MLNQLMLFESLFKNIQLRETKRKEDHSWIQHFSYDPDPGGATVKVA